MSDNVRTLPGGRLDVRPHDPEPVPRVIRHLEHLLERARRGEIQAVAYTFVRASGHCSDGWADGDAGLNYNNLAAGLLYVSNRYAGSINAKDVTDERQPEGED